MRSDDASLKTPPKDEAELSSLLVNFGKLTKQAINICPTKKSSRACEKLSKPIKGGAKVNLCAWDGGIKCKASLGPYEDCLDDVFSDECTRALFPCAAYPKSWACGRIPHCKWEAKAGQCESVSEEAPEEEPPIDVGDECGPSKAFKDALSVVCKDAPEKQPSDVRRLAAKCKDCGAAEKRLENAEAKLANLKAEAEKALNVAQNLVQVAKAKADAAEKRAEDAEAKLANATASLTNPPTSSTNLPTNNRTTWIKCSDGIKYSRSHRIEVQSECICFPFLNACLTNIISLFLAR